MSFQLLPFYAFALVAVASSLAMVGFVRGLAPGVVCLLATMVSLSLVYALVGAPLVAAVQLLVHAVAAYTLLRFAIERLRLESGFTTRTLSESAIKGFAAAGVLLIAIAFAIKIIRTSPIETAAYAMAPVSRSSPSGAGAAVLFGLGLGLVLLTAAVAVGLFVRWRAD